MAYVNTVCARRVTIFSTGGNVPLKQLTAGGEASMSVAPSPIITTLEA